MSPKKNLAKLSLKLPEVSTPGGSYVLVNIRGIKKNGKNPIRKIEIEIEIKLKDLYRYCLLNKIEVTKDLIIQKLDGRVDKFITSQDFFQYFDYFLEKNRTTKAERTIKGYTTVKNFLVDFEKERNYKLNGNSINLLFFEKIEDSFKPL